MTRAERNRQRTDKLTDAYIAQILKKPVAELRNYPDLIELKREVILLKRAVKDVTKANKC